MTHDALLSEAEAEENRMSQATLDHKLAAESMRMKRGAELKQTRNIAATVSGDSQALWTSISKRDSA